MDIGWDLGMDMDLDMSLGLGINSALECSEVLDMLEGITAVPGPKGGL